MLIVVKRTEKCFGCGKSGHKVRDFPTMRGQYKDSMYSSGSNDAPKKNYFCALHSKCEQETFLIW